MRAQRLHALSSPPVVPEAVGHLLALDLVDGRDRGSERQRLAAERAGIEDVLHQPHDIRSADDCGNWHAISHGFAEAREIRRDAVTRLRTADRPAEAGDDFVEDQQRAMAVDELLKPLQIARRRLRRCSSAPA